MKVVFVVNPRSGVGRAGQRVRRLERSAERSGVLATVAQTSGPGDATKSAAEASRSGAVIVAAVGGDGTANEVARGLIGTSTSLALIPTGSGNGLARELGVSLSLERAVAQLRTSRARRLDVGMLGDHPFLMTAGFGIDARVAREFGHGLLRRRGVLPYLTRSITTILRYRPRPLTIEHDGRVRELRPLLLVAANTRQYGLGAVIAPMARPDDGQLDVVTVPSVGPARALWYAAKLFTGSIDLASGVEVVRTRELEVRGDGPLEVQIDGEPLQLGDSAVLRVAPRALSVWAPWDDDG